MRCAYLPVNLRVNLQLALLFYFFKIGGAVLAERAYEILGQCVTLVYISADLADKAFFFVRFGLRLDIALIVGICHRLSLRDYTGFGDGADEHAVRIEVDILLDLERHERIDVFREKYQPVVGAENVPRLKLVRTASAAEPEILEYRERRVNRQAVNVHFPGLLYNMVGVVRLVYRDRYAVRGICHLRYGVYDQPVVLPSVV